MDKEGLAKRLQLLRLQKGVTQNVVALNIGLGRTGYLSIESGHTYPSVQVLVALADYFKVSLDYLCGRDNYLL
jgi:transcriptional regulator with XRE-family HTH domain